MHFKKISLEHGASSSWIFNIAEDSLGYIWFAGHTGLSRFDGNYLKNFYQDPNNPNSISDNQTLNLHVTPENNILISTIGKGLNIYNSNDGTIQRIPYNQNNKFTTPNGFTSKTLFLPDGSIIGSTNRPTFIFHLDPVKQRSKSWPIEYKTGHQIHQDAHIYDLLKLPTNPNQFLAVTSQRLYLFDLEKSNIQQVPFPVFYSPIERRPSDFRAVIFFDEKHILAGMFHGEILMINIETGEYEHIATLPDRGEIKAFIHDENQKYWVINYNGKIFKFDAISNIINTVQIKLPINDDINFTCGYKSKSGILYLGTFSHGVLYYDPASNIFSNLSIDALPIESTNNKYFLTGILHPNLPYYYVSVTGLQGIMEINLENRDVQSYKFPSEFVNPASHLALWQDSLLLVHNRKQLFSFSPAQKKIQLLNSPKLITQINEKKGGIINFFTNGKNQLVMALKEEWWYYDFQKNDLQVIDRSKLGDKTNYTFDVKFNEENIYLLTDETLYKYNTVLQQIRTIALDQLDTLNQRKTNRKINFYKDLMYLSTTSDGIYKFKIDGDQFKLLEHITSAGKLISNNIYNTTLYDSRYLWIATGLGLQQIDLQQNKYIHLSYNQNLPILYLDRPVHFNQAGYFASNTIKHVFWTLYNNIFKINDLNLLISTFKTTDEEKVKGSHWPTSNTMHLNYRENFFQIGISCLRGSDAQNYEIRGMLKGFDQDWRILTNVLNIEYTNVPPGKYNFVSEVYSLQDPSNVESLSLEIQIHPPYWQTGWFRLLIFLLILGIIILLIRIKINAIRREEKIKTEYNKQLAELELQSLRSQMNPHFMFNSLNSIKHYILKNEREKASEYLSNFANLIRSILNFSKVKFITLEDELNTLKTYIELEQLRFSKGFEYTISLQNIPDPSEYLVQPLLLQPYIENSIWHGLMHKKENRRLQIQCSIINNLLHFEITDNGIGRAKAKQINTKSATKKSFGLSITETRMRSQNLKARIEIEDLTDEKDIPCGTKVTLVLPLIHAHLNLEEP